MDGQSTKVEVSDNKKLKQSLPIPRFPASPPSSSSSPSHEFSFTISLHSSSAADNKANPFAIDLSPADEIFFHGHLLPLHLLSNLPVSPRASTNSLEGFDLPIKDDSANVETENDNNDSNESCITDEADEVKIKNEKRGRNNKQKSFSLFSFTKWRKGLEAKDVEEEEEEKEKRKKKLRLDFSDVLKRYARLIRPLLFSKKRQNNNNINRNSHSHSHSNMTRRSDIEGYNSFSGNLRSRNKQEMFRGRSSAPASMRPSPTNSGHLLAAGAGAGSGSGATTKSFSSCSSSSGNDSTMEELQAAIQAAIAHCKNSVTSFEQDRTKKTSL